MMLSCYVRIRSTLILSCCLTILSTRTISAASSCCGSRRFWFPLIIMYRLNGLHLAASSLSAQKHCTSYFSDYWLLKEERHFNPLIKQFGLLIWDSFSHWFHRLNYGYKILWSHLYHSRDVPPMACSKSMGCTMSSTPFSQFVVLPFGTCFQFQKKGN